MIMTASTKSQAQVARVAPPPAASTTSAMRPPVVRPRMMGVRAVHGGGSAAAMPVSFPVYIPTGMPASRPVSVPVSMSAARAQQGWPCRACGSGLGGGEDEVSGGNAAGLKAQPVQLTHGQHELDSVACARRLIESHRDPFLPTSSGLLAQLQPPHRAFDLPLALCELLALRSIHHLSMLVDAEWGLVA